VPLVVNGVSFIVFEVLFSIVQFVNL